MTNTRVRRPPPPFRKVAVASTTSLTPRMQRVTLAGPALDGFETPAPAASVRLLLPTAKGLVIPGWSGNEFLLPDRSRPPIRTLTPRQFDPTEDTLTVDVVLHGTGLLSAWAAGATPDDDVAVSGPGRGYWVDPDAPAFLLLGDETALPAISQLLGVLPPVPLDVHIEVGDRAARAYLDHDVAWHLPQPTDPPGASLLRALEGTTIRPGTRIWAAGEAAGMQRLRRHLFDERAIPRTDTTIRGYWKR